MSDIKSILYGSHNGFNLNRNDIREHLESDPDYHAGPDAKHIQIRGKNMLRLEKAINALVEENAALRARIARLENPGEEVFEKVKELIEANIESYFINDDGAHRFEIPIKAVRAAHKALVEGDL